MYFMFLTYIITFDICTWYEILYRERRSTAENAELSTCLTFDLSDLWPLCLRKDVEPEEKIEFKTRLGESDYLLMMILQKKSFRLKSRLITNLWTRCLLSDEDFECRYIFKKKLTINIKIANLEVSKFGEKLNRHQTIADRFRGCILANMFHLLCFPHGLFACI